MKNKIIFVILMFFIGTAYEQLAQAQTVSVTQELDFGEAVIINNNNQHIIDVQPDGSFTADPEFVFLQNPSKGILHVTGLLPSIAITNITVAVQQHMEGPGEDFTIGNFNVDAPASSDSNGELIIDLGARMQTSGNNQPYFPNSSFESVMEITIQY